MAKFVDTTIRNYTLRNRSLSFHHCALVSGADNENPFISHTHSHYEILQLVKGEIAYIIDGKFYEMTPGSTIVIDRNRFHMIKLHGSEYERRVVEFGMELLSSLPVPKSSILLPFLSQDSDSECCLSGDTETAKNINGIFDTIENAIDTVEDREDLDMIVYFNLLRLLIDMKKAWKIKALRGTAKTNPIIEAAVRYINEHLCEKLSLTKLERELNVSKFHLSHIFRETMGTSVINYVNAKKIHLAEDMILNGANPTEVSITLGYKSYSNFYGHFQSVLGRSPSDI